MLYYYSDVKQLGGIGQSDKRMDDTNISEAKKTQNPNDQRPENEG